MNSTKQSPTSLSHLNRQQRVELKASLEEKERRRCARDREYWLFKYAKTQDEHDPSIAAKPFPDKEYLRWVVRQWLSTRQNLWEKSRQMMASWTFCALYLHDTQFKINRLNFIQSKKEEDSDALIRRCWFIYENQEQWLKAMFPAKYSYCHIRFYKVGDKAEATPIGHMWGIPQGGDVLRQHTASGLFIDEGAFQPDLESSIRAAQPMLTGGGRIDVVSSAQPGYFQELVEGRAK